MNDISIQHGDFLDLCTEWPDPDVIVSDGAYGLRMFPGDPSNATGLVDWYRPHVEAWSRPAPLRSQILWFWCTEVGWATVHPLLVSHGWKYHSLNVWDKGNSHIAGRVNSLTAKGFPVVTEVCVLYRRHPTTEANQRFQEWMRAEWKRSGLPFKKANEACGVKNAASRKYLTACDMWYAPQFDHFEGMRLFCDNHGDAAGRPYFVLPTKLTRERYNALLPYFDLPIGWTNVWNRQPLRDAERLKDQGKVVHANQKPLDLTRLIVNASLRPDGVLWEPFGGTATASVATQGIGRAFCSEIDPSLVEIAKSRITESL